MSTLPRVRQEVIFRHELLSYFLNQRFRPPIGAPTIIPFLFISNTAYQSCEPFFADKFVLSCLFSNHFYLIIRY